MLFIIVLLIASIAAQNNNDICSKINDYIQEGKQRIEKEKSSVSKGIDYQREQEPQSINAVEEKSGDVQRIFEYIAEQTNISNLQENEQNSLKQEISSCPSFQELVTECRSIITEPECDPANPYRTFDGTCNNPKNPRWGSLFAQYRRHLPSHYVGVSGYRESVTGGPLPNPRNLSVNILRREPVQQKELSFLFVFFGQLIAHDTTEVPLPKVNGQIPECCPFSNGVASKIEWCDSITPDASDPYYSKFKDPCMLFFRYAPKATCDFGTREYLNNVPSFLDCHINYGRTEAEANILRTNDGTGRLMVQNSKYGGLMLGNISQDDQFCFVGEEYQKRCFFGGDSRVNQHTTLMSLETLFTRQHNRMADELHKINPQWDGEKIYQVARKINGAIMQCITYKQYLPHLFGKKAMKMYDLNIGGSNNYDDTLIPNVALEFAGFGFRLHSTINTRVGKSGCANVDLKDTVANPEPIHEGCLGNFLRQTAKVPQNEFGPWMVKDMTDFFFRQPGFDYGNDVGAIDIKRGRDLGLPPYVNILSYVLGRSIRSFDDLRQVMPEDHVQILKQNYKDVRDVDSIVGMVMENHVSGSIVGPTVFNITVDHFQRQKSSDRFYFENQGLPNSFTPDQINEIRKFSLSKLICDNTNTMKMPLDPFVLPGPSNSKKFCRKFKGIDLSYWKE